MFVQVARRFTEVPSTWEGWAMRVLTIGIVIVLIAAWLLAGKTAALSQQIRDGRNERNTFQVEQAVRVCALLRHLERDPDALRAAKC